MKKQPSNFKEARAKAVGWQYKGGRLRKQKNSGFAKEMQQLPEEFASALRVKLEAWVDEMVDDKKED